MTAATTIRSSRKPTESISDAPANTPVEHTATQSAALENLMTAQQQIATLRAQQKALAEQAKQLEAAIPARTPLEKVIARQVEEFSNVVPDNLRRRIAARVKAGQDRETATNEVISFYLGLTNSLLDTPTE